MSNSEILWQQQDQIGFITFNRPEARNALTVDMYHQLAAICENPPEGIKTLVISGNGDKAFAAGTDISHFRAFKSAQQAIDYEATMDEVLGKIESCPVPTIASICGACTGGGAVIASACDIRIASHNIRYGFPIARTLGNCLSAANINRLNHLLGVGRVREIIFTCRLIEAEEALAIGLVSEILPDPESLRTRSIELAEQISNMAPLTLRSTKVIQQRLMQGNQTDRDWIVKCYTSDDFKEGLDAFLSKRKPHWTGR